MYWAITLLRLPIVLMVKLKVRKGAQPARDRVMGGTTVTNKSTCLCVLYLIKLFLHTRTIKTFEFPMIAEY